MTFNHDTLIAHVHSVTSTREFKGDDRPLACNVGITIHQSENTSVWPDVLADIIDGHRDPELREGQPPADEAVDRMAAFVKSLKSAAVFGDYIVNFRSGSKKVAKVERATLSSFTWNRAKGADSVTFNVHAVVPGSVIGQVSEQLGYKIRLETACAQTDMEIGSENGEGDAQPTTDTVEA